MTAEEREYAAKFEAAAAAERAANAAAGGSGGGDDEDGDGLGDDDDDDDDGGDDDRDASYEDEAFGRGKSRSGLSRGRKELSREVVIAPASKRLWSSAEARERWVAALRPPKSAAAVALAVTALPAALPRVWVLREGKERGMLHREELPDAFVVPRRRLQRQPPTRRSEGRQVRTG